MSAKELEIYWTEPAVTDLEHVEAYVAKDNPSAAVNLVLSIIDVVEKTLPSYPGVGREGRLLGTRELVVHENYLVPYRVKGKNIEILRVLHVARKWPIQ